MTGEFKELQAGIEILSGEMGFVISNEGFPVDIQKTSDGELQIHISSDKAMMLYDRKNHFFRALGILAENLKEKREFHIIEKPMFDTCGAMFDCSRNAVLTVEGIKQMLRYMAVMGLNMMMLYTEDTFFIEGEPWFGYMRGRYTFDELKECDDYAYALGIEIIPCIQTLGHLRQFLKWGAARHLRDTDEVLLSGEEESYRFIEKMIQAASAPFRSKRMNIGMDEAWDLGLGRYLEKNGYRNAFDIFKDHLQRIVQITNQYNIKPMIWSDMFFCMASASHKYYDLDVVISKEMVNAVPAGVDLVLWDYYHRDEDFYIKFLEKHFEFGRMPLFAGGLLTCGSFCSNYKRMFEASDAALTACKKQGVKEVFATAWGDDGAETNLFSSLIGLQLYAEHCYSVKPDFKRIKERVNFCTGMEFDAFYDLALLDTVPGVNSDNYWPPNVSKYLLWQDPLLGLFDRDIKGLKLKEHYQCIAEKFKQYAEAPGAEFLVGVPRDLARVLSIKSDLGLRIREHYKSENRTALEKIVEEDLSKLIDSTNQLKETHRKQWFTYYKPFGWEVLDLRYGGLVSRIESTKARLLEYINGTVDFLEELEEDQLNIERTPNGLGNGYWKLYRDIVSANVLY